MKSSSLPSADKLIACPDCDLLHRKHPLQEHQKAQCTRCGAVLYRQNQHSLEHTLTFALAGLVFFVLANVYPLLTFELQERTQQSILFTGVRELYDQDMWLLAVLVLCVSILIPLVKILGLLYLLLPLHFNRRPWRSALVLRLIEMLHPWAMIDVYMLGVLVAIVKLSSLATIVLGIALYSFAALIIMMAAADAALEPHLVWERLEKARR
jgi:paraquat-inducible protein A